MVGDGIKFWKDRWVGDERLRDTYARLFNLDEHKEAMVAERGLFVDDKWEWNWAWRREPRGREFGELEGLRRGDRG